MPTKKITITLDVELIEALKKEMKITRRSMANLVNHLLFEALEKTSVEDGRTKVCDPKGPTRIQYL